MSLLGTRPRPRPRFMLTPLVDVMFLLLIFFMLSSQTSPYSLLDVAAQGQAAATTPTASPATTPAKGAGEMIVSIARGYVRFNGARVELAELGAAIDRFKSAGYRRAVVTTAQSATVQDVVSVLEALEKSDLAEMRLVTTVPAP